MAELLRMLTALMALFSQLGARGPLLPYPTPLPTQTATVQPSNTPVPTFTPTPQATATRTRTFTPTATVTHTPTPFISAAEPDPFGINTAGLPPAQRLPSAVLIYPFISTAPGEDTLIEMVNLTNAAVRVKCHYVDATTCRGIDFFVDLTALQPVAWRATTGQNGNGTRLAPPLVSDLAELKCFVQPNSTALSSHNALQGRALVQDSGGETVGYPAVGFRRLIAGSFTGTVNLDGNTYEQCPDRLHFQGLASRSGSDSELILVPCDQNLETTRATSSTVQFAVVNELEQNFSGSISMTCMARRRFSTIPALRYSSVGTTTLHAIVRSVSTPVMGLVIERFTVPGSGATSTSANLPFLEGGRNSTISLPNDF